MEGIRVRAIVTSPIPNFGNLEVFSNGEYFVREKVLIPY